MNCKEWLEKIVKQFFRKEEIIMGSEQIWKPKPVEVKGKMKINLNTLAVEVSKLEGKKVQQPIAQIKEGLKCERAVITKWLKQGKIKPSDVLKMYEGK